MNVILRALDEVSELSHCCGSFLRRRVLFGSGIIGLLLSSTSWAQQESSEDVDIVDLSPFTVQADDGYRATNTLAGTRIKTEFKDIANSISVLTKDLMDDLNATDAVSSLIYVGNAEVAGVEGNLSGGELGSLYVDYRSSVRDPLNANRVRGLARADSTRDYFPTSIRFDSYNTQRVEVNRGPNAVLFGLGSPGGIINNQTVRPMMRTLRRASVSFGSFGTRRLEFDLDHKLNDQLGLRVAGLHEDTKFRQNQAFERDKRVFASLLFKPTENGNLNASIESGSIDASRPRPNAPRDTLTRWWEAPFNQITHSPAEVDFGLIDRDLQRAMGSWFYENAQVFYNEDDPDVEYIALAWYDQVGIPRSDAEPDAPFRSYMVSLTSGAQWFQSATAANYGIEDGSFWGHTEVGDRSVFDWVEQMLDGSNKREWEDFEVLNLSYDHSWQYDLGSVGVEASYSKEESSRSWLDMFNSDRGYTLTIDINTTLPWGVENPNFGRPFLSSTSTRNTTDTQLDTKRLTAFGELDFKRGDSHIGGLLGRHTLTGFVSDYSRSQQWHEGQNRNSVDFVQAIRGDSNLNTGQGQLRTVVYLGPSLAGRSSAAGAAIPPISADLNMPQSSPGYYWDANALGFSTAQSTPSYASIDDQFYATLNNADLRKQETMSSAFVYQLYLFEQEWLVGTYGFRHDEVDDFYRGAVRDPNTFLVDREAPDFHLDSSSTVFFPFEADTTSYGIVAHAPEWLALPEGFDFSLHYNKSENFQISQSRRDIFGEAISPPQGTTNDRGFSLRFGRSFNARFNWYKTASRNVSHHYAGFLFETDRRIIRYNTKEAIEAAGYQGPPDFYKELVGWMVIEGANTPSGFDVIETNRPNNLSDTTSTVSEGFELDLVWNPTSQWKVAFNAAQQKASQGEIAPATKRYLDLRLSEWTSGAAGMLIADESDQEVRIRVFDTLINGLNGTFAREGQNVQELREWRWSLINSFAFEEDSNLSGFSIGNALRWEDQKAIGYPITSTMLDDSMVQLPDLANPYYGDSTTKFDFWVGYERPLKQGAIDWMLQLSVRNALSNGDIEVTAAQPDGSARSYAWREGRTINLRSRFEF